MASPNILGATAGVGLGHVLVIMLFSAAAVEHIYLRYEFCYGFTAVCVVLVLALGRLTGCKAENFSILETVMLGSVISQGLKVVTMYLMYNMQEEDMLRYQEVTLGTYTQTDAVSMLIFFAVMAAAIIPVLLMRYHMNVMGLDKMETASIGVSSRPMRIVGQFCGILMVTGAMIHCGEVGMLSLVIPYIVRRIVGADFRKVCVYSALAGGSLLMICRLLTSFILLLNEPIPVVFIVNLLLIPAFMVILAGQRRAVI
jgi:iron complex transport system permease protein